MITVLGFFVFVVALAAVALRIAALNQRAWIDELLLRLDGVETQGQLQSMATAADVDWSALPTPVARYLRMVLPPDRKFIRRATLRQIGRLRTDIGTDRWMSFEAVHNVAPLSSGFVWNARVSAAPLVHVRVLDSLVQGRGSGKVLMMSAFPVGFDSGTPEMNSGSLHRYLAEGVWYPTALLPSKHLAWHVIDERKALATLSVAGTTVSLEFSFNDANEVVGIYSPGRWGSFQGRYQKVAWEGHFRNYEKRGGMLVPLYGEVGWYADGTWRPVWEGSITEVDYAF